MSRFLKKISYAITTIILSVTAIFFVIRLSPGDPVEVILGPKATYEEVKRLQEQLGLDLPIAQQYLNYLSGIIKGDFGKSLFGNKDVVKVIYERMFPTMTLASISVSLSACLGMGLGIFSGHRRNKMFDKLSRFFGLLALSFPIFSLAPILVILFAIMLNWFPVSEWGELKHIFLPTLTLIIPLGSVIMRVTRNKFLEEINSQWVIVVKSKGIDDFGILLRVLKICLPTIFTVVSIQLSVVIAGTMITETIFDIPGMGSLLFEGIQSRDYPIVQGVIIYSTICYMVIYFALDFINEKIDPRIAKE